MARIRKVRPKQSPYITPEGYERYRLELKELWEVERVQVTKAVAIAAAEGDRSENAEYIYGKIRLRKIHARVRFLTKRLEELNVVESGDRADTEKVFFGAWVRVENDDGDMTDYRIVGPDEHDMDPLYVSMDAPMGRALMGKRLDDEVTVRRPKGDLLVTILEVQYSPFPA